MEEERDIDRPLISLLDDREFQDVTAKEELWNLMRLSMPVALSTLCRTLITSTDTSFIGKLGAPKYLTASTFAATWQEFVGNIVYSPGYALNSLCAQAIGAGNKKLAGTWLQLATVITTGLCIPVLGFYLITGPVVKLMVAEPGPGEEPPHVPELAQQYSYVATLLLWPMVMYMTIRQYFQALHVVKSAMIVSFVTVGFNYLMNMIFVHGIGSFEGWGLKGSPFATFLSMVFQMILFCLYTCAYKGYHKDYWGGWSWECLEKTRVQRFMKMVIPMTIGTCMESWGMQVITFSTGHIGEANVAAFGVLGSLFGILWAFYWGWGLAMQVRVGTYLGKGHVQGAKMVMKISLVLVFVVCSFVGVMAYLLRSRIANAFSNDAEVIRIVEDSTYSLALCYFSVCLGLCAVNLLEAMAQTRILAITLTVGMWCVTVPLSLLFAYVVPAFKDQPVVGLWLGQAFAEMGKSVVLWSYIYRLDWDELAREALERSEVSVLGDDAQPSIMSSDLYDVAQAENLVTPLMGGRSPITVGRKGD